MVVWRIVKGEEGWEGLGQRENIRCIGVTVGE